MSATLAGADQGRFPTKVVVYAKTAALTSEICQVGATWAIKLEAANGTAGVGYRWQEKIAFLLGERELPAVASVALGYATGVEFGFHGTRRNKFLRLTADSNALLLGVREGARDIHLPIQAGDVYLWGAQLLTALKRNAHEMGDTAILACLRATAARLGPARRTSAANA